MFDAKKVLDSRFPTLVTRCDKRSKKIFKLAVFGAQVDAFLIDFLIADDAGNLGVCLIAVAYRVNFRKATPA